MLKRREDIVTVVARLHPMREARSVFHVQPDVTVDQMLTAIDAPKNCHLYIEINGCPYKQRIGRRGRPRRLKGGDLVGIRAVPRNFPAMGMGFGGGSSSVGSPTAGGGKMFGVMGILSLLMNRGVSTPGSGSGTNSLSPFAPPRAVPPNSAVSGAADVLIPAISGISNQKIPWEPFPRYYGNLPGVYPPLAATVVVFDRLSLTQDLQAAFVLGPGPLAINNPAIGGVPFNSTNFPGSDGDYQTGDSPFSPFVNYPNVDIEEVQINDPLLYNKAITVHVPQACVRIYMEIAFPSGLYTVSGPSAATCVFDVQGIKNGGAPVSLLTFSTTATSVAPWRPGAYITVAAGDWDIIVTRTTADSTGATVDESQLIVVGGIRDGNDPIVPQKDSNGDEIYMGYIAVQIQDSTTANGIVGQYSVDLASYLPKPNYTGWTSPVLTANPACVFADIICGNVNARRQPYDILDLKSLSEWFDFCGSKGYDYNCAHDQQKSAFDYCKDVAAAGRASLQYVDGRIGVFIEQPQDVVTQHFTPRNSSGFTLKKTMLTAGLPHGIICHFLNPALNNQQDEYRVYRSGYDETNATLFETKEFPGVTNTDQLYSLASYQLNCMQLRQTTYEFTAETEVLVCQRGDLVWVASDANPSPHGESWARITAAYYNGSGDCTGVDLDDTVHMETGGFYTVRVATPDNSNGITAIVTTNPGDQTHIEFDTPCPHTYAVPKKGQMLMFGYAPAYQMIITGIEHNPGEYTAKITCQDYADGVYT